MPLRKLALAVRREIIKEMPVRMRRKYTQMRVTAVLAMLSMKQKVRNCIYCVEVPTRISSCASTCNDVL